MPRAAILAFCLGALAACSGDVLYVDVRPAEHPTRIECSDTGLRPLTSVKVSVIRETADGLEEVPDLGSCQTIEPTNQVADMLKPFEDAGVFVSGAPAGSRTLLRFIGYMGRNPCYANDWVVCGITCPLVKQGEIPEGGVETHFICDGPLLKGQVFDYCLNLDQLTEDARAEMCDPNAVPEDG